ncbi:SCO family protein [Ramlibacter sp. MMS24-I3-19]|uniref:SCO family protein n=1 Tax=Ramlibacter sp. MMS24-I3-19 TaxID=3416606 RepID=UPI003CFC30D0
MKNSTLLACLAAAAALSVPPLAGAHDAAMHAHGMHSPAATGFKVRMADYATPDVQLVRQDGQSVSLPRELDDGRPVVMNFIYTTCTTICPVMSLALAQMQERLGADSGKVHMVSISIDPEQDTPTRLRDYARRFSAGPQWQHYTGTVAASIEAQKAFGAYQGDKMAHDPLTLIRMAPGRPWMRIDGFATGADLAEQYAKLAHASHVH